MTGIAKTRRDAATLALIGLGTWLLVPLFLVVAIIQFFAGSRSAAIETLGLVGISLAAPFVYGWQVIAGPPSTLR